MSIRTLSKRLAGLPISQMGLVGGALCLDFVNTLAWRTSAEPHDRLQNYDDLLAWSAYVGLLTPVVVEQLYRRGQKDEEDARRAVEEARLLRETMHRIFLAISAGTAPDDADLTALQIAYGEAIAYAALVHTGEKYAWRVSVSGNDLRVIGWCVAVSAVELLASEEVGQVRQCQGEGCGFLFVDQTRNHSRQWCTGDVCGNRARVRRHYARSRKAKG